MNEEKLTIKEIQYGTEIYHQMVNLRDLILRKPLGIVLTAEQLAMDKNDFHLACFYEKTLIGCLVLTPKLGGKIQMRQVAVLNEWQGKGIGGRLVKFSEMFAKEHGFKEIIMHARGYAVNFYLNQGYEVFGEPFTEVTILHRHMRKEL